MLGVNIMKSLRNFISKIKISNEVNSTPIDSNDNLLINKPVYLLTDDFITQYGDDLLKHQNLSETLKEIIIKSKTPLTIGLYGEWGSGKTSLMQLTQNSLQNNELIKTIWFDAWKFDKSHDLRVALILTILSEIENQIKNEPQKRDLSKKIRKNIEKVDWLTLGTIVMNQILHNPINYNGNLLKPPEDISIKNLEFIGDFENEFKKITKEYVSKDGKLVIFIDDLDRCIPEKAIDVLESMKLFLNVERCLFIIGADKKVIENGIRDKYQYKAGETWGENYLDKIVQIPFFIPPIMKKTITEEFIENLDISDDIKKFKDIISQVGNNPRKIKRLLNQFELQNILAKKQGLNITDEKMAKLTVIQFRYPKFHDDLIKTYIESDGEKNLIENLINYSKEDKLKEDELIQSYIKEKGLIKFLNEEPQLVNVKLDDYVYLVKNVTEPEEKRIPESFSTGLSLLNKRKFTQAIEFFNKALEENPKNAEIWLMKGIAYNELHLYIEAIESFKSALKINKKDVEIWYNLGIAQAKSNKRSEAYESFYNVLELNPDHKDALKRIEELEHILK